MWTPPPGYVPVRSILPGIEAWGPGVADAVAQPTCPRCGAPAGWDAGRTRYGCTRCDWTEAAAAASAGPGTFTRAALAAGETGWGGQTRVLRCEACGAEVLLPEGTLATVCTFCASPQLRVDTGDPGLRPHGVLPFALPVEEARVRVRTWLGSGWRHPRDLGAAAVDGLVGVYLPFWRFAAHVHGDWSARVGHVERTTRRDAHGHVHVDERVRWRDEQGAVDAQEADVLVPGSGDVPEPLLAQLFPVQFDAIEPWHPGLLATWRARAFTLPLADAWTAGRTRMSGRAADTARAGIVGAHVHDFAIRVRFADERWEYVLLPVYVAAYRYGGKVWQVVVDGRAGKVVGPRPVAWTKVLGFAAGALIPGLVGLVVPPVGLVLLLAGMGVAVWLLVGAWHAEKGR